MLATKQEAAALTTALEQNLLTQACAHSQDKSSTILEQAAALLLYLQTPLTGREQQTCWRTFESKLRQHVGLRSCGRRR